MRKAYKDKDKGSYIGFPILKQYGMLTLKMKEGSKSVGYYIMKKCEKTLDKYIRNLKCMEPTHVF